MEAEVISGLATRIEAICQDKGLTFNKLAKQLDMSSTTFYQLTSGRTKQLSLDVLIKFNQVLGINIDWLVTGAGNMYIAQGDDIIQTDAPSSREMGKVAEGIEVLKRFFEDELKAKNQQIAGLQRTVDALVGKSEGATLTQLYDAKDIDPLFHQYRLTMLSSISNLVTPVAGIIQQPSLVKSVALS